MLMLKAVCAGGISDLKKKVFEDNSPPNDKNHVLGTIHCVQDFSSWSVQFKTFNLSTELYHHEEKVVKMHAFVPVPS